MKYIKLYTEQQKASIELVNPMPVNSNCTLCALHEGNKSVCLSAEGEPGGLLVVGDHPFKAEDSRGRPFCSTTGISLRRLLKKYWDGPIALDYAIRCAPSRAAKIGDKHIAACQNYLARTIDDVRPERIITTGSIAMKSILGRGVPSLSCRKGFGWVEKYNTPVFTMMSAQFSMGNRFLQQWFEDDLKWALTSDISELRKMSSRDGYASLIETEEESIEAVDSLRACRWIAYDVETVGRQFNKDFEIISLAITGDEMEDAYIWSGDAIKESSIMAPVLKMLADESVKKVAQNAKYDATSIYAYFGTQVKNLSIDTRLLRKILEPESKASLDVMQELCGMGGGKEIASNAIKMTTRKIQRAKNDIDLAEIGPLAWTKPIKDKRYHPGVYAYGMLDPEIRDRYCGRDAVSTARLAEIFEEKISREKGLKTVWSEIMLPAARAIEKVEAWGVYVDQDMARKFSESVSERIGIVHEKIIKNGEFNLNSTKEMQNFLYTQNKLPIVMKTNGGAPSTNRAALDSLLTKNLSSAQREIVESILEYRTLSKLQTAYASRIDSFVRDDGRIHPSFDLTGARSGRISCSDPNVQQIPRASTPLGAMARSCFAAPKGRVLIQLDYSQLELRVVAMLSRDKNMIDVFKSGEDYHKRTAQLISKQAWGIPPEEVTKKHRTAAKSVNFGLLYGMSLSTLAGRIGCTVQEATKIQNAVFGSFPNLKKWCDEQLRITRREGVAYTYWNNERARVRPMFRIADHDDYTRKKAEHGSWNTPVQGSASDLCLASLARCVDWIHEENYPAKLVLTVHDSLLFEVDEDKAEDLTHNIKHIMGDWPTNGVPLVVDAEIGYSWGNLEAID